MASAVFVFSGPKTQMRFATTWTPSEGEGLYLEKTIDALNQDSNGKYLWTYESAAGHEHETAMRIQLAADNMPDVYTFWPGQAIITAFKEGGAMLDMDKYLKDSKQVSAKNWNQEENNFYRYWNDGIYVLPIEAFHGFFNVNKSILDRYGIKPPTTFAELVAAGKVLRSNGIIPIDTGSKGANPGHLMLSEITYQFKGAMQDVRNIKSTGTAKTEAILKGWRVVEQMRKENLFPDDTIASGDWDAAGALYNQGKAAMEMCYPWMIQRIPQDILANTVIIPFPKIDGTAYARGEVIMGGISHGLCINPKSYSNPAKKAGTIAMADILTSDAFTKMIVKMGATPARLIKLAEGDATPFYRNMLAVKTNAKYVVPPTDFMLPGTVGWEAYMQAVDGLFAGEPADQMLDVLQKGVVRGLSQ